MQLATLERWLLGLSLFLLPIQIGRHFWPEFTYIYSLPIDYFAPTIYLWDLVVFLLITVSLFTSSSINRLALNLWLIFILTQAVSLLGARFFVPAVNLGAGLVRIEQLLIAGMFGVYLASLKFSALTKAVFYPLGLVITVESLLGVAQFIQGQDMGLWILGERDFSLTTPGIAKFDFYGQQFLRPYSTFPHPNVLAGFMLVSLPLLKLLAEINHRRWFYPLALLSIVSIMLSVSRSALFLLLITGLKILKSWRLGLLLAGLLLLSPIVLTRFASLFNHDFLSWARREELAGEAIKMYLYSPIFGVGSNNFINILSNQLISGPGRFIQPVHNIYLLSLAETGLVGFLGLTTLVVAPVYVLFKNRAKNEAKLLLLSWFGILTLGLFDHYFLTLPAGYRLLFLVWGLSWSAVRLIK